MRTANTSPPCARTTRPSPRAGEARKFVRNVPQQGEVCPMPEKSRVDFWFDPFCPWSWITSRWILEARQVRDFDLEFHLLALAVLNEDDLPPQFSDPKIMAKVWAPTRVLAAAE